MSYKNKLLLLSSFFIFSCIEELDVTQFTKEFQSYNPELRVEALMLPEQDNAIIRIDKTISSNHK